MQIQILTATPKQKPAKTPGKTYSVLELAYKNLTFQGKVEGRDLMSFGGNKPSYDVLINAVAGEVYDIEVVKNAAGFNDWVSAKKSDGTAVATQAKPASSGTTGSTYSASPKSTYETPEERAVKQIYIVRQSNISAAISALSVGAKAPPKVDDILAVAKEFENHVFGSTKAPVDKGTEGFKDLESDDFPDMPQ